jgi:DNA-binding XRE family transcriptional regulator
MDCQRKKSYMIYDMRQSAPLSNLTSLRQIIGLSQTALAALVGKSVHTIQSIEQEKLLMSKELAVKLSHETGIDVDWIMSREKGTPPLPLVKWVCDSEGRTVKAPVYSAETFEQWKVKKPVPHWDTAEDAARLIGIASAASHFGESTFAKYEVDKFLGDLEEKYNRDTFKSKAAKDMLAGGNRITGLMARRGAPNDLATQSAFARLLAAAASGEGLTLSVDEVSGLKPLLDIVDQSFCHPPKLNSSSRERFSKKAPEKQK